MNTYQAMQYNKSVPLLIIINLVLIFTYGCGNNYADNVRGENEIWIKNASFIPDTLNIPLGSTVTWINHDPQAYTVISDDTVKSEIPFNSGSIPIHDTFNYTFNNSGIYHYYCKINSKRIYGVIVVQ